MRGSSSSLAPALGHLKKSILLEFGQLSTQENIRSNIKYEILDFFSIVLKSGHVRCQWSLILLSSLL